MSEELKPCKCGKVPDSRPNKDSMGNPRHIVWCTNLRCYPPEHTIAKTEKEAVMKWNYKQVKED